MTYEFGHKRKPSPLDAIQKEFELELCYVKEEKADPRYPRSQPRHIYKLSDNRAKNFEPYQTLRQIIDKNDALGDEKLRLPVWSYDNNVYFKLNAKGKQLAEIKKSIELEEFDAKLNLEPYCLSNGASGYTAKLTVL